MRRLIHSVPVKAPSSFALAYLRTHFLERRARSGGATLALRFGLPKFPIEGLTLEKSVALILDYRTAAAAPNGLAFGWQPDDRSALPSFGGTISALARGDDACSLTVAGSYTPPGGAFGAIFDRLVGLHIARATLAALMTEFQTAIEADFSARLMP